MKAIGILPLLATIVLSEMPVGGSSAPSHVVGWGFNLGGQATGIPSGNPPATPNNSTGVVTTAGQVLSNVIAVATGMGHSLALRGDGTVVGWGGTGSGEGIELGGLALSNAVAISAGRTHCLALKSDGEVVAWGESALGQTALPTGLSNVVAISAGGDHSLALKKDGTVAAWGEPSSTRLPDGLSNVIAIAAAKADYGKDMALKRDGTLIEWSLRGVPAARNPSLELTNVTAISSGWNHRLALRRDGTVFGWGANPTGAATGIPTSNEPSFSSGTVTISGQVLSNVVAVVAGNQYSLALKNDGTVVSWGRPPYSQLPVPAGLSNVVAIAAGENFCLAITTSSNLSAFGK